MMDYSLLTERGKLFRLHSLAVSALEHYDLRITQVAFHCYETNPLYRVNTSTGERFILRLATPGWRTESDLQAEALWLDALRRDTSIPVPRVLEAVNGNTVLPMEMTGTPDVWYATLMGWQPGRLLSNYLTPKNLQLLGSLFALLHIHGKDWTPPIGFSSRTFAHFLSRDEPDVIFIEDQLEAYNKRDLKQLQRLHKQVESAYAGLDREDLRVIHCDLWHGNVKLHRGSLLPFDFEDTVWGFRLHDIAMAMLDLLEDTDNERYPLLLDAFRRGYVEHLEWPEGEMEVFQIGRLLWKVNYVARFEWKYLSPMVERHVPLFNHFEHTGKLRLIGS